MKYKILSFVIGIIVGLLISFGYSKIFNSDSTNQVGNFGPMGGQFSGSGRPMNGSGRFMNDEERQREVTEETGEQGILKDEEGKTLEEETQEIPENENGNKAFSGVVE